MQTIVLNAIPETAEIRTAWNALALSMERPQVFYTYEWSLAASRAFAGNLQPLLFLMYESDRLAGIASLAVDESRPDSASFLTATTADYCDVLSEPRDRTAVVSSLLKEARARGVRELILANLPEESATFAGLPTLVRSCRYRVSSRPAYGCSVVNLQGERQHQVLLKAVPKKTERWALKKLAASGAVEVLHSSEPAYVDKCIEPITYAQIARFLVTDRVSPLVYTERRAFLRELSGLLGPLGWMKVSELRAGEEAVAWNYGFRFADTWFWYLPTFRVEYETLSPGSCLLRLLVEQACADPSLRNLDLGLGDESYKDRFATEIVRTRYVRLSTSLLGHLVNLCRNFANRCAVSQPRAKAQVDRIRGWVRRLAETGTQKRSEGIARYLWRKLSSAVNPRDEIQFFEAGKSRLRTDSNELVPLTFDLLAEAAIAYANDFSTLPYLVKCAKRLRRTGGPMGYAVRDPEGRFLHFSWVASRGDFASDITGKLDLLGMRCDALLIFDSWTPVSERRRGHFESAIRLLSQKMFEEGRQLWIFSSRRDPTPVRSIFRAGFSYRFSMVSSTRFVGSISATTATTNRTLAELPGATKTSAPGVAYHEVPSSHGQVVPLRAKNDTAS